MLKTITKPAIFSAFTLGLMMIANQVALAEELENQIKESLGWGIGGLLVILALGIWATIFWIMMIVHVAKHDVENKAMWVILMVFTGIVGALIYYFVVKRKFSK